MAYPQRKIKQRAEAVFQHCVAFDLAPNVMDDAAEARGAGTSAPDGRV